MAVTVPANATATVCLPAESVAQVTESGVALADTPGVLSVEQHNDELRVQIGSGAYTFLSLRRSD